MFIVGTILGVVILIGYGIREYILTIYAGSESDDVPMPVEKKKG